MSDHAFNHSPCCQPCQPVCLKKNSFTNKLFRATPFIVASVMIAIAASYFAGWFVPSDTVRNFMIEINSLRENIMTLKRDINTLQKSHCVLETKFEELAEALPILTDTCKSMRDEIMAQMAQQTKIVLQSFDTNTNHLRNMFEEDLMTYDADKIAQADYALESSGGKIVTTRNTEPYTAGAPALRVLGVKICHPTNAPEAIIQPGVLPGECWAFKGSSGSIVIQLVGHVHITAVSLEHIPQSLSPTGDISTAPKEFSVWGVSEADDTEGFFFGQFTYNIKGKPLQQFPVMHEAKTPYPFVELKIHSNHGNKQYTCVYRFRVNGQLKKDPDGRK